LVQPAVIILDVDRIASTATADRAFEADGLLITIARRLSHLVGSGETLARLSGDQFGVLILAQRSAREMQALVDHMRLAARALIQIGSVEITPKVAVGYAVHDRTASTLATDVLEDAEIAMHRARRTGRDEAVAFTPDLRTDRRDRAFLEADLREAIDKKQLTLQYQPIYLMRTQEIAGYEALVRWEHPRLGKLDPAEFVPLAEGSDLIVKLGSAVIAMAVADLQRWHATYERPAAPLTVSVNVSRRQLIGTGLVTEIRDVITRASLPRGSLRLEITETLVMENPEHATKVLGELAAAGAGLSLDDFGTGSSSLTYLNVFPFDTLKIDRALVHGSSEAGTVSAILRSVITLAHELGKKVVAEGIETEQDAAALRTLGCEYAQGFYYGVPQSPRDVIQSLKDLRKAERRMKRGGLVKLRERKPPAYAQLPKPATPAMAALPPPGPPPGTAAAAPSQKSGALRLAQAAQNVAKTARLRGAPATTTKPATPKSVQPPALAPAAAGAPPASAPVAAPPPLAATARPALPAGPQSAHKPSFLPRTPAAIPAPISVPISAPISALQRSDNRPLPAPQQAAHPSLAADAANASLAALGAQMAASASPPPTGQAARDEVPADILNALARSMSTPETADHAPSPVAAPAPGMPSAPRHAPAALDLSTLPPGIAASLARLAGQRAANPAQPPEPAPPGAPAADTSSLEQGLAKFTRPPASARN
jgi:EAL domain-containing protein (putative c-di-GMP-specific phosphodiesterase class I)/GGDEF domain-containing protein